jgi:hypothetical protein
LHPLLLQRKHISIISYINVQSTILLRPPAPTCSENYRSLLSCASILHSALTSCSFTQNNSSPLSGVYWFTPPFSSNLLLPPSPKIIHLCSLVHPYALLHSAPTSCSISENNSSPLSGVYWFIPSLCSDILHPPAPKMTHVHSLVHPCALLCSALTSCIVLLRNNTSLLSDLCCMCWFTPPLWSNHSVCITIVHL